MRVRWAREDLLISETRQRFISVTDLSIKPATDISSQLLADFHDELEAYIRNSDILKIMTG